MAILELYYLIIIYRLLVSLRKYRTSLETFGGTVGLVNHNKLHESSQLRWCYVECFIERHVVPHNGKTPKRKELSFPQNLGTK